MTGRAESGRLPAAYLAAGSSSFTEFLSAQAPTLLEYKFGMGDGAVISRVRIDLTPESEAVKVVVSNDGWNDDDPTYSQNADGWPRILSRLKTLLETGKTFKPH